MGASPGAAPAAPAPIAARPSAPPAVQAQIDRGQLLFSQTCTTCHGLRGEGTPRAPALIGDGTLPLAPPAGRRVRTGPFRTAMDLGMFIKNEMPYGGTHLPPSDVACVVGLAAPGPRHHADAADLTRDGGRDPAALIRLSQGDPVADLEP